MKELIGDIFELMETGEFDGFCVTTNGEVKKDGKAVMGAGIAKDCRDKFPGVDERLAFILNNYGVRVAHLGGYEFGKIIAFPTKNKWRDPSDIQLIKKSCKELMYVIERYDYNKILLPKPGCSNGKLSWDFVKKEIEPLLDERVYIVSK